jgi:hypothetical protein
MPLTPEQIEAAGRLHGHLKQWQFADHCLALIRKDYPHFDHDACSMKTIALDRLYGTYVRDLPRTAKHVQRVIAEHAGQPWDVGLVVKLATIPASKDGPQSTQASFASKFAHFFLDACTFPMMDKYAKRMVAYHLGKRQKTAEESTCYLTYFGDWTGLRKLAGLTCSCRELDRYLWMAGQYRARKAGETKLNREFRDLIDRPEVAVDLQVLVPSLDM